MEHPPLDPVQAAQLMQTVSSLVIIRDALVTISLALTDLRTESPTRERDEVMAGVQHYLDRFAVLRL
jgi:hypothetical protein